MKQKYAAKLNADNDWETQIWKQLRTQFGISPLPGYRLLRSGKKRIRIISESAFEHFLLLPYTATAGLYLGEYSRNRVRLSMDGAQLLGPFATKNIVELDTEQATRWLQGESIIYEDKRRDYVIVMQSNDILGCGRLSNGILHSFVPKIRRLK